MRVQGSGLRVRGEGPGLKLYGFECGVQGLWSWVGGLGFRTEGSGCGIQGLWSWVCGLGSRF